MSAESELRRQCETLSMSGFVVVAYSFWDMFKTVATMVYGSESSSGQELFASIGEAGVVGVVAAIIAFFLVYGISLMVRLYVGLSAGAEARGARKGWGYVVVAVLMAALNVVGYAVGIALSDDLASLWSVLSAGIIELTSLYALVDLVRSAVAVKRAHARLAEGA